MKVVKIILRKSKRVADKVFGTAVDEFYWKFRHIFDKKWPESYFSPESLTTRELMIDEISRHLPLNSVLEVGCASGPNLYMLAKKYPKIKFYGVDISKKAIEAGKNIFKKEKINNIFLEVSSVERLQNFENKSIDLIFSNALLIYIGPDKIKSVIEEISRVARKKIIFFEWHDDKIVNSVYRDHWIYNYRFMINKLIPHGKIKINRILPLVAKSLPSVEKLDRNWAKFGNIIEVRLQ